MGKARSNHEFVKKTIEEFIPDKDASILVCGSAQSERDILSELGYSNCFFTGMDLREKVSAGIASEFENVESLSFDDDSFDFALIKDTVHHTALPSKVLTELFRVSRNGYLVVEGRDSMLIRVASRLALTEQFEVAGNFSGHGVNGTDIPNFIFRWTEREVEKTLKSFAPHFNHHVDYRYHSNYPDGHGFRLAGRVIVVLLKPVYLLFTALFPRQQNLMAFFVTKPRTPDDLKPWITVDPNSEELIVDREWIKTSYTKKLSK